MFQIRSWDDAEYQAIVAYTDHLNERK
jgi:hypothetical protein